MYTWGYNYYGACLHEKRGENHGVPLEIDVKELVESVGGDGENALPIVNISAGTNDTCIVTSIVIKKVGG